jgi:hypothetical protein
VPKSKCYRSVSQALGKQRFARDVGGLGNYFRKEYAMTKTIVLAALAFAFAAALEVGPELAMVLQPY